MARTPTTVSNALLETVTRCSLKTVLTYVHRRQSREENANLLAGTAIHQGIHALWSGQSPQQALKIVAGTYKKWALAHIDSEDKNQRHVWRFSWHNVHAIFKYYAATYPIEKLPFIPDPKRLEIRFTFPLTKKGDIVFRGVIDASRVRDRKTGSSKSVDHKTTGNVYAPWFAERFYMDSQMTGYFWVEDKLIPEQPISGMWINAVEISWLPGMSDPSRKCGEHKLPYAECQIDHLKVHLIPIVRTRQSIKDWRFDAIQIARRYEELIATYPDRSDIEDVPQEGRFNGSCGFCDFKSFCLVGRPAQRLDAMTAERGSGGW